jgi:diadenosine tetraphosphate (Ap4A) HIT family hydrolase
MNFDSDFALHPRLAADTRPVGDLPLCRVLLLNDSRFPWLVLVPRRDNAVEIHELTPEDRAALIEEIAAAGAALKNFGGAEKINIGALGNIVSQLHVHVVARSSADPAWPGPVWGFGAAVGYDAAAAQDLVAALTQKLGVAPIAE